MNPRIKELLSKANLFCYDDGTVSLLGETYVSQAEIQKFAELILTEVTDILATYRMKTIFLDGIEYNCQHPIYAIRKHFGVEP
jgi:hypothetical protein